MTVIAAIKTPDGVYMCGDLMVSDHNTYEIMTSDKIAVFDDIVIGVCGSVRVLDAVHYQWSCPDRLHKQTDREYIVQHVVETLRETIKGLDIDEKASSSFAANGRMIIVYKGEIYTMDGYFSTVHSEDPIICTGSGEEMCRGYLQGALENCDEEAVDFGELLQNAVEFTGCKVSSVGGVGQVFLQKWEYPEEEVEPEGKPRMKIQSGENLRD